MIAVSFALALFAAAQTAPAAPPAPTAPAAAPAPTAAPTPPAKKKDDPNRVVCTREHVVGSNRPQRICMTVREREELRQRAVDSQNRQNGAYRGSDNDSASNGN